MPNGIAFIDKLPVVAHDNRGVNVYVASGSLVRPERWDRPLWRKHLETELRKLNAWEAAERREMGHVLAFKKQG